MVGRILFILAVSVSVCHADVILVDVGGGDWREISFSSGQITAVPVQPGATEVRIVRLDFDGGPSPDPDPDPPTPTGLRGDIATAAKSANDKANAEQLSVAYQSSELLIGAGASLFTVVDLLVKSEEAVINTPEEINSWQQYRSLTVPILRANPVTDAIKPKIAAISSGLKDAVSASASPAFTPVADPKLLFGPPIVPSQ